MTQALAIPFRVTLQDALKAQGREAEAHGTYCCQGCARTIGASLFYDVRDQGDAFPAEFVCSTCCGDLLRSELVAAEAAERDRLEAAGIIPEEELNALRAERDRLLAWGDVWELPSNIARIGEARVSLVVAWKDQVRAVITAAKEGRRVPFPPRPDLD